MKDVDSRETFGSFKDLGTSIKLRGPQQPARPSKVVERSQSVDKGKAHHASKAKEGKKKAATPPSPPPKSAFAGSDIFDSLPTHRHVEQLPQMTEIHRLRAALDAVDPNEALRVLHLSNPPSEDDLRIISDRLLHPFVARLARSVTHAEQTDLVIGVDIGSTSTKLAIRLPYEGSGAAQPVPVPAWLRADDHPYYWRTLLWEDQQETYHLFPKADATMSDQIKVGFLKAAQEPSVDDPAILRATAYLALMIRQAAGWFAINNPRFIAERGFFPQINVGFPAASLEMDGAQQLFRICASAAGRLATSSMPINAGTVFDELVDCSQQTLTTEGEPLLVDVFPELSGAIAGFASSMESRSGKYVLADIGGLTFDCIFFNLSKENSTGPRYSVYAADLCQYGADMVKYWMSEGATLDEATKVLGNFVAETVSRAHNKISRNYTDRHARPEVQTLLIGGGRRSVPHRQAPAWAERSLRDSWSEVKLPFRELAPLRRDMDVPLLADQNIGRLLIACGLSLPRDDIPVWTKARDVPDATPVMARDIDAQFVSKDQI